MDRFSFESEIGAHFGKPIIGMEVEEQRIFLTVHLHDENLSGVICDQWTGEIKQDIQILITQFYSVIISIGVVESFSGNILLSVKPTEELVDLFGLGIKDRLIVQDITNLP